MADIRFNNRTKYDSLGRNGHLATFGVTIMDIDRDVLLEPITSKGVGRARLVIDVDALPALIAEFQRIYDVSRAKTETGYSAA